MSNHEIKDQQLKILNDQMIVLVPEMLKLCERYIAETKVPWFTVLTSLGVVAKALTEANIHMVHASREEIMLLAEQTVLAGFGGTEVLREEEH